MLELRNLQAELYRNDIKQGIVKIKADGSNQCDWNVLNNLTQEQRKELDRLTKNLVDFLAVCSVEKEEYFLVMGEKKDNIKVVRKIGEQKSQVGIIRRDNHVLVFTTLLNEGEIELCIEQINDQHMTDFYYGGDHYDGD